MKKLASQILMACLVVLLVQGLAWGQSLWQNTTYGMSVEQVSHLIPGCITPAEEDQETLAGGARELLRLPDVTIVGKEFHARFFFADGRLVQVMLHHQENRGFPYVRITFDSVTEVLRAKYGPELTRKLNIGGIVNESASASWLSDRTNISVLAWGAKDSPAGLNINYQVRIAKEADKL